MEYSVFFFFKQKTAYEMRISDWSSDVCSSDLPRLDLHRLRQAQADRPQLCEERVVVAEHPRVCHGATDTPPWRARRAPLIRARAVWRGQRPWAASQGRSTARSSTGRSRWAACPEIGRASWRERVGQYV